jgi:hypothetical protein
MAEINNNNNNNNSTVSINCEQASHVNDKSYKVSDLCKIYSEHSKRRSWPMLAGQLQFLHFLHFKPSHNLNYFSETPKDVQLRGSPQTVVQ